jgi:hypothetical protein
MSPDSFEPSDPSVSDPFYTILLVGIVLAPGSKLLPTTVLVLAGMRSPYREDRDDNWKGMVTSVDGVSCVVSISNVEERLLLIVNKYILLFPKTTIFVDQQTHRSLPKRCR